jgi:hypothetical protein
MSSGSKFTFRVFKVIDWICMVHATSTRHQIKFDVRKHHVAKYIAIAQCRKFQTRDLLSASWLWVWIKRNNTEMAERCSDWDTLWNISKRHCFIYACISKKNWCPGIFQCRCNLSLDKRIFYKFGHSFFEISVMLITSINHQELLFLLL